MKKIFINHRIFKSALFLGLASLFASCQMSKTQAGNDVDAGDTIPLKYAQHLTMVKHGEEYTEVILANLGKRELFCIATFWCLKGRREMKQ